MMGLSEVIAETCCAACSVTSAMATLPALQGSHLCPNANGEVQCGRIIRQDEGSHLGCKMHYCVNVVLGEEVADQVRTLDVTLDQLRDSRPVRRYPRVRGSQAAFAAWRDVGIFTDMTGYLTSKFGQCLTASRLFTDAQ